MMIIVIIVYQLWLGPDYCLILIKKIRITTINPDGVQIIFNPDQNDSD